MEFKMFCQACKYRGIGAVEGHGSLYSPVCRKTGNIPEGESWGNCTEQGCPFYGIEIRSDNAAIYQKDGKIIGMCAVEMYFLSHCTASALDWGVYFAKNETLTSLM